MRVGEAKQRDIGKESYFEGRSRCNGLSSKVTPGDVIQINAKEINVCNGFGQLMRMKNIQIRYELMVKQEKILGVALSDVVEN